MQKKVQLLFIIVLAFCVGNSQLLAYAKSVDAPQKDVLTDERTISFMEKNQEVIVRVAEEYNRFDFMIDKDGELPFYLQYKEERVGIYPQFFSLLEELTGIQCFVSSVDDSFENYENFIKQGEVDAVFGITLDQSISNPALSQGIDTSKVQVKALNAACFANPLVLAIPSQDTYTKDNITAAYWGTTMEYQNAIMGTILDGHTIIYNTAKEMEEAFLQNEIQGMLLPKSKLDYQIKIERQKIKELNLVTIQAQEFFLTSAEADALGELVNQLATLYQELYSEYYETNYEELLVPINEVNQMTENTKLIFVIVSGCFVVVLILYLMIQWHNKRQFERMLRRVVATSYKIEDVLRVNLRTKKIQSKLGFAFYGFRGRIHKKTIPLKEMTKRIGFDFTKYYEYILQKNKTEFTHEFELYIQGVAYHYVETGVIQGKRVASRIYRKEK